MYLLDVEQVGGMTKQEFEHIALVMEAFEDPINAFMYLDANSGHKLAEKLLEDELIEVAFGASEASSTATIVKALDILTPEERIKHKEAVWEGKAKEIHDLFKTWVLQETSNEGRAQYHRHQVGTEVENGERRKKNPHPHDGQRLQRPRRYNGDVRGDSVKKRSKNRGCSDGHGGGLDQLFHRREQGFRERNDLCRNLGGDRGATAQG